MNQPIAHCCNFTSAEEPAIPKRSSFASGAFKLLGLYLNSCLHLRPNVPVLALDKVNLRWGIQNHWKESGWRKEGDRGSKVIQELYRGMDVSTDSAKGHSDYELKQERAAITVAREGKGFTLRNLSECGKKASRTKWTTHNF